MPLLQLYNSMKEKAQTATQPKKMASSPEPFSTPEDEFGDFIWNNGPRKKPLQPTESDHVSSYAGGGRVQEIRYNPGAGNFAVKLAEVVPMAPDELFVPTKRSVQVGLSMQDDDAGPGVGEGMDVPWITYNPTEEGLPREIPQQDDYCAVFLTEFSAGFDLNGSTFRSPADHRSSCRLLREVRRSEHGRAAKTAAAAGICCRPQDLSHHHGLLNGSIVVPEHCKPRANDSIERLPQQQQKQERRISPISPCRAPSSRGGGGGGLINFSHFMRPFALAKGSLEGNSDAGGRLPSGHETTSGSKPPEKTLVDNGSAFKCISTTPPPLMADAKPAARAPHQEAAMVNVDQSGAFSREDHGNTRKQDAPGHDLPSSSFAASAAMSRHERKRLSQASEASSSCSSSSSSGNSHGEAPNHYKRRIKRKHHEEEAEDSGHFMRLGAKKHVYRHRAGTKWSRAAAEVHNVSERRRRDRINERMRALQELIPNCNKVDKASMLQEAIEYLKSLQFQLQMMSMGSGSLYMPQTVARGMQLFGMPTMAPFPAVGMGLGFGMGMYDMNSSSAPLFAVPSVYTQRFGPAVMPRLPLDSLLALSMKANMASGSPRTSAPLTQQADSMMAAVTSDQDKRGKDLHAEAVQKPNYC